MIELRQSWPMPNKAMPIVIFGAGSIVEDAHLPAYSNSGFEVIGIYDPNLDTEKINVLIKNDFTYVSKLTKKKYSGIIRSLNHNCFKKIYFRDLMRISVKNFVFFDLHSYYNKKYSNFRL